jgi:hypothetical protein
MRMASVVVSPAKAGVQGLSRVLGRSLKSWIPAFAVLTVLAMPIFSDAAEVTTIADVRFLSGQHFFNGAISSVAGNLNASVTPAVKFNERWSLFPTWQGEYRGTRDVQELAGGGTLFEDSTRQSATFKAVRAAGPWKHKLSLGAAAEWLRETKDEEWGNGLFDNLKFSGGLETQYDFSRAAGGRLAYDFYRISFPNYLSLETSSDPTLSRELAGEKVLDSDNHMLTYSMWSPFPGGMRLGADLYYNLRSFADQNVVDAQGQFTGTGREDKTLALSASLDSRPYAPWDALRLGTGLRLGYAVNDSNQNHFDARKVAFLGDYYDYDQMSVAPRLTAALGERPWLLTGSLGYVRRQYADRPAQDDAGDYVGGKTKVTTTSASLGLSYPYSKNFKVQIQGSLAWSDSNQRYEKVFRYNYKIANYMVGFSYEY